jgi:hypothetical protein
VVSVAGSGGAALVTVETPLTTATFVCNAADCNAVEHSADANHPATSISGKHFGFAGDQISVLGKVTAISCSGNTAALTVTLTTSGLSITVPAGACRAASAKFTDGQFRKNDS